MGSGWHLMAGAVRVQRTKPRVTVLRGYSPNAPHAKTQSAPVSSGVTIYSGQVVSLSYVSGNADYEWVLGCSGGHIPYIALQDSADYDVVSANSLVGLSMLGDFEIQTGYFSTGTYNVDTPVTYDPAIAGNIIYTTVGGAVDIMGYVTRNHGYVNLGAPGPTGYPADSSATNENVVVFQTGWVTALGNT